MFGIGDIKPKDLNKVLGYYNLLKSELIKSKRKSQSGSKEKFTLEKIYAGFPNIRRPLARNSSMFKEVKMKDLYHFISTNPEEQSREMYDIMCDYLDNQMHNFKEWKPLIHRTNYKQKSSRLRKVPHMVLSGT